MPDVGVDINPSSHPNLPRYNQHQLIIIDGSGKVQQQVIGYGDGSLSVIGGNEEVIYVHDSFLPDVDTEVLTKMKNLSACFNDAKQCAREQVILVDDAVNFMGSIRASEHWKINISGQLFSTYKRTFIPETFCALDNRDCTQAIEKYMYDKQQCYQGDLACSDSSQSCLDKRALCMQRINEKFLDAVWVHRTFGAY